MAINDDGEWWTGSVPADILDYLQQYTHHHAAYPATAFRLVKCHCGSKRFKLERAWDITRRTCAACRAVRYICRNLGPRSGIAAWQEARHEETPEEYVCVGCGGKAVNVGVGFAGYAENPEIDAIKWFYVGARCARCGILGTFNDGKVGRGPAKRTQREVTGEAAPKGI